MKLQPLRFLARLRDDVAVRGGLLTAAVTLIALVVVSAVFWRFLIDRLERRAQDALLARHGMAVVNELRLDDSELEVIRRVRRSLPVREEGVFAWIDEHGVTYSSSVNGLDCREGYYDRWIDRTQQVFGEPVPLVPPDQVDPTRHDRFRFFAQAKDKGCLVFGRSLYDVDAANEAAKSLLVWLVPVCMVASFLVSLGYSYRLRRRLKRVGNVLHDVSKGNLSARVPIEGSDDIDRLGARANRSLDRLQDSVGALQQLSSVMAHDLRAPLNRLSITLEGALEANRKGEADADALEEVKSGLGDLREVFDALLRISQIESGRRRSNFAPVDLQSIAESLYEIYEAVVDDSGKQLVLERRGEGSSRVNGDAALIQQAVVNLIENAVRYTPEGAHIRIVVETDADQPALSIIDNGPGVPAEQRPMILRRLYRYEASTSGKSGHGLGLSLVKAVMDLHDGDIQLDDANPGLLVRLQFNTELFRSDDVKLVGNRSDQDIVAAPAV